MSSLLDRYILNQENFERCICNSLTMPQLLILFRTDNKEMDKFCEEIYGVNFSTAYTFLRTMAVERFADVLGNLSMRGNNTAMNIMDRMMNNVNQDKTVKIVFDSNSVQAESEEDKANG